MWQLNQTRLGCAAGALGVAGGALDLAIKYANERTQFGKPISQHQMVQAQIAEMMVEHQAAQMLVYRAAWLKDSGKPNQYETSVAKLAASEAAVHAANECMKIYGSLRLFDRVSGRALLPRRQVAAGRRRHVQHPEDHHLGHGLRDHAQPRVAEQAGHGTKRGLTPLSFAGPRPTAGRGTWVRPTTYTREQA